MLYTNRPRSHVQMSLGMFTLHPAVGILAAHCAQHRGAKRVILIDNVDYRLQHAKVRPMWAPKG
jgi:hypothetical protein